MKEKVLSLELSLAWRRNCSSEKRPFRLLSAVAHKVNSKLWLFSVVALLLLVGWAAEATAQVTTARLEGLVKDQTDAVVPGVTVVATQDGTNIAHEAISNETGLYIFAKLSPGSYTLMSQQTGFKRSLTEGVRLEVGDTRTLNITLEAGEVVETVRVTAEATTVDTVSTSIGAVVNENQISNLPLVGRNPLNLFFLQAGTNRKTNDPSGGFDSGYYGGRVDGLRSESNNVVVEGVSATDPLFQPGASVSSAAVPIEAVSEYRVVTSSASAEFGRGGGAQVQLLYKSGTNEFHGTAFEFHRNRALNANTFFGNKQGLQKPTFIRHQFGGSVGGPIIKNKAFFHFTYEGIRQKTASLQNVLVYTPTLKTGIYRYYTRGQNSGTLVDANGNPMVPAGDIGTINLLTVDPTRLGRDPSGNFDALVGSFPAPNNFDIGDGFNTGGFRYLSTNTFTQKQFVLKGDYVFNSNHRLGVTWAYRSYEDLTALLLSGFRQSVDRENFPAGIVSLNSTLTPSLLNEFRIGVTKSFYVIDNPDPSRDDPRGIIVFAGLGGPGRGHPNNIRLPQSAPAVPVTIADNVTWVKGNHTYRGGFDIRVHITKGDFGGDQYLPVISTAGNAANVPARTGLNANDRLLAQQYTNDITGSLGSIAQTYNANATDAFTPFQSKTRRFRAREYSFFFQDTWKFRPNLTLQLGLRWEIMPPHFEANDLFAYPVGGARGLLGISGDGESRIEIAPNGGGDTYRTDWNNFAPNVGFNWDPTGEGKWSVSANYRVAYDRNPILNTFLLDSDQEGASTSRTLNGTAGQRLSSLGSLFNTSTGYFDSGTPLGPKAFNRQGIISAFDPDYYTPYTQNWSVRIQRELWRNTVVQVAYVGNKATGLPRALDINQIRIRSNGFLTGFLAAQRNQAINGPNSDPRIGEPTGVFGRLYGVMTSANQATQRTNLTNGAVASAAELIDRTGASINYLQAAGLPLNFFRANPQFNQAFLIGNNSYSTWNGLKIEVNRRFSSNLQFGFNYTFSKGLTDFDGGAGSASQRDAYRDNENPHLDKSLSPIVAKHVFNGNFVLELPIGKGQRWLNSAHPILNGFFGGWKMNGIIAYSSGLPLTVTSGRNKLTLGDQSTANCNQCDPGIFSEVIKGDTITVLTNDERALFTQPDPGSPGNLAQRYFRGPNFLVLDGSVFKSFPLTQFIGEQGRLEFRFEFFNLFNHANFGNPNVNITNANFGSITSTSDPRIAQMALKLYF
ncbi:MAG: TonB-dependent receptor [Pyrinomonadaceae bacterium]|nr:TonB-dependent receptor [Pyrinomonadaceae bacterium]